MTEKPEAPPVHCAFTAMVPVAKLRAHPKNPNKHDERQIALLAHNIKKNGWRWPVKISSLSGHIISGHCRLLSAKLLGLAEVPVDAQEYKTEADEILDMLADNQLAELADLDLEEAHELYESLPEELRLATGFQEDDFEEEDDEEGDGDPPEMVNFKATKDQAEVIKRAIRKVRKMNGNDISEGRALELMAGDALAE